MTDQGRVLDAFWLLDDELVSAGAQSWDEALLLRSLAYYRRVSPTRALLTTGPERRDGVSVALQRRLGKLPSGAAELWEAVTTALIDERDRSLDRLGPWDEGPEPAPAWPIVLGGEERELSADGMIRLIEALRYANWNLALPTENVAQLLEVTDPPSPDRPHKAVLGDGDQEAASDHV
jgi:hypothetical protein